MRASGPFRLRPGVCHLVALYTPVLRGPRTHGGREFGPGSGVRRRCSPGSGPSMARRCAVRRGRSGLTFASNGPCGSLPPGEVAGRPAAPGCPAPGSGTAFFGFALMPGFGPPGSAAGARALIPRTTRTILPASMCLSTTGSLKSRAAIITWGRASGSAGGAGPSPGSWPGLAPSADPPSSAA